MMRPFVLFAAFAVTLALATAAPQSGPARAEHATTSPEQLEKERAFRQYLLDHPEIVLDVIQLLRDREQVADNERRRGALVAHREALLNDPTSPIAGNPDGDVTIVEFFDYHCPYCKRVLPVVEAVLDEDPGVRLVYKEFPILGPDSVVAARAGLAAFEQDPDKYPAFHDAMMSSRARLNETRIMEMAAEVGLDAERLKADMAAPEIEATIARNRALAQALGISGTPAFVIGDRIVPGAIDLSTLKQLVARARSS